MRKRCFVEGARLVSSYSDASIGFHGYQYRCLSLRLRDQIQDSQLDQAIKLGANFRLERKGGSRRCFIQIGDTAGYRCNITDCPMNFPNPCFNTLSNIGKTPSTEGSVTRCTPRSIIPTGSNQFLTRRFFRCPCATESSGSPRNRHTGHGHGVRHLTFTIWPWKFLTSDSNGSHGTASSFMSF